jgi:hypothetical protein
MKVIEFENECHFNIRYKVYLLSLQMNKFKILSSFLSHISLQSFFLFYAINSIKYLKFLKIKMKTSKNLIHIQCLEIFN